MFPKIRYFIPRRTSDRWPVYEIPLRLTFIFFENLIRLPLTDRAIGN